MKPESVQLRAINARLRVLEDELEEVKELRRQDVQQYNEALGAITQRLDAVVTRHNLIKAIRDYAGDYEFSESVIQALGRAGINIQTQRQIESHARR